MVIFSYVQKLELVSELPLSITARLSADLVLQLRPHPFSLIKVRETQTKRKTKRRRKKGRKAKKKLNKGEVKKNKKNPEVS